MASQNKNLPSQKVITSMLKELGINDYEPRVINQLLEFTYRYVTCILDDAKVYASHAKKKGIDIDDVKLAIEMQLDRVFTTPPSRDILLEIARTKNNNPLPLVKPHCGVRLPPDRYCLNSCNYRLKSVNSTKKVKPYGHQNQTVPGTFMSAGQAGLKISSSKSSSLSLVKRPSSITTVPRTQSITAPKPVIKYTSGLATTASKIQVKPKIQVTSQPIGGQLDVMSQNIKLEMEDNPHKRKREDDSFEDYESRN